MLGLRDENSNIFKSLGIKNDDNQNLLETNSAICTPSLQTGGILIF